MLVCINLFLYCISWFPSANEDANRSSIQENALNEAFEAEFACEIMLSNKYSILDILLNEETFLF